MGSDYTYSCVISGVPIPDFPLYLIPTKMYFCVLGAEEDALSVHDERHFQCEAMRWEDF